VPAPGKLLCLDTNSELAGQLLECHGGPVTACAFGPRLGWAVSGGWDGHLLLWDPTTGNTTARLVAGQRPITALATSPDGSQILVGDMDGRFSVWNSVTHERISQETVHARPIGGIATAGNGKAWATAGWDGVVRVWIKLRPEEQPYVIQLRGHTDVVAGCKFWPDGRWLLTWSHDGNLILWDIRCGQPYQTWNTEGQRIVAADIAPSATLLAAATDEGKLLVWNLYDSQHPPYVWQDDRPLRACLFSPNALELLAVSVTGLAFVSANRSSQSPGPRSQLRRFARHRRMHRHWQRRRRAPLLATGQLEEGRSHSHPDGAHRAAGLARRVGPATQTNQVAESSQRQLPELRPAA
jgi:WD40 repeat protein